MALASSAPRVTLEAPGGHAMSKGQVKGRAAKVTGKIEEVAGKATGDRDLEAEGRVDKKVGKMRSAASGVKKDVKRTVRKTASWVAASVSASGTSPRRRPGPNSHLLWQLPGALAHALWPALVR